MIEDIINSLKNILQTNLPAQLDLIELARPGITLPDPTEIRVVSLPEEKTVRYPFMVLNAEPSSVEKHSNRRQDFTHKIEIQVFLRDHDEERRERILWRYFEAINNIWRANTTWGGKAQASAITGVEYAFFSPAPDKDDTWAKGISITLEAQEKVV